ncbi:cold-shock protein [Clostridium thermarum]|uniref:cold-shock protein n=1 Tax=Clostridium thermarum TaxID=1716543 RepID=UPI00111F06F5|nr:cold shock domain-containing protein [Clostridium thermarum]
MSMYTGVVKWFDNERGYGFISANNGDEIFVHKNSIRGEANDKELHEGSQVTFDVVEEKKGPMAINVQKL